MQNERRKKVFLVDGGPAFTTSTDKAELLGEQLIARGLVLPMEVDMALALCPRYGGRLGDALVGLGVLRPVELFRALVAQTHERFVDLLAWKQGQIDFIRGVRVDGETLLHGASAFELIAEGVEKGYTDDEIERIMTPLLGSEVCIIQPRELSAKVFRLPPRQTAVLSSLDAPKAIDRVIEDFGERGNASRGEVLRAVFIGLSAQLLCAAGWPLATQRI
jgi:serine/threonine-protein kinase